MRKPTSESAARLSASVFDTMTTASTSTTLVAEGWDWAIYADPCDCPKWIVAGVKSCEPYPCFCAQTRRDAPDFVAEPQCWWRKRGTGRLASRCPCWGRKTHPGLPRDCCGWHEANPQYLDLHPDAVPGAPDPATASVAADRRLGEIGLREPAPAALKTVDGANKDGQPGPRSYPTPRRRWQPDEITCPCETPWDNEKRITGYHCVACHTNWRTVATAMVHQRSVLQPCRDPESIVDPDTGRRALRVRIVNGHTVWDFAW